MTALTDTVPLLPAARAIVIAHQRGSISLVQRHLQIGYNAASELLEMLERDGVVGPVGSEGEYGRKVLAARSENAAMAQTTKERQESLRARRAMLGTTEVRGVFLPPDKHAELKAIAAKMLKAAERNAAKPPKD
jgi:DNA segregation ATPase FtsK/SpoIIIE-like protein